MPRRQTLEVAVLLLFLGSLALPAIVVESKPLFGGAVTAKTLWGIHCFALGILVLPGWLANPFLLVAVVLHSLRLQAAAVFTMVLAVASAWLAPFLLVELDKMPLLYPHVGYFAWLASMLGMLIVTIRGRVPIPRARATFGS